jgi:dTDP-4-dehydrorhamnose reductase
MRILITGAAGRLGGRLAERLRAEHDVTGIDIAELDLTDFAATRAFIGDHRPDIVLHPAAWTDVEGCAREPDKALRINGYGTQHVALAAAAVGAAALYISSNEVFDGRQPAPYREYDPTAPVNPYGYSKWVGEQTLLHANPRHYIVRTAWLFAHGGTNFIQAILNAARAGNPLRVVIDEVANPTYNDDLAEAIARLIMTERYGIYHFTNSGACSRLDFARYALARAGLTHATITAITHHEWPRLSTPPLHAALANTAGQAVGITLRPWQEAVDAFLEREGLLAG